MSTTHKHCLIAYFSRAGDNFVDGGIARLPVGNTAIAAGMIQELTGGGLFRIETVRAYPEDYTETTEVAKKELREDARPELVAGVDSLDAYDLVFLGYPNWWGTMPMAVCTFLESCELAGKTIAPFCTHGGSGLGRSEKDIARLCPDAALVEGLAIHGAAVKSSKDVIARWVGKIRPETNQAH